MCVLTICNYSHQIYLQKLHCIIKLIISISYRVHDSDIKLPGKILLLEQSTSAGLGYQLAFLWHEEVNTLFGKSSHQNINSDPSSVELYIQKMELAFARSGIIFWQSAAKGWGWISTRIIIIMKSHTPLHATFAGSGFHCPFSMHVVVLDPTSIILEGQPKVTLAPSRAGLLYSMMSTPNSSARGRLHWAKGIKEH